jgi:hypothetical protein
MSEAWLAWRGALLDVNGAPPQSADPLPRIGNAPPRRGGQPLRVAFAPTSASEASFMWREAMFKVNGAFL